VAHRAIDTREVESEELVAPERITTFYSLRFRDFRYMWQGQIGASASQWMEQLARPFLILELTDSAFLVGLIAATRMAPMLLVGLWAGVIADRMNKKRILQACQAVTFASHGLTAILIFAGLIEPWMVFLGTFATGSAQAFNQPARSSLIPRLVPRYCMANALGLNSAAFGSMRVGGPAIGGLVLAISGFEYLYALQTLIYVWVIGTTSMIAIEGAPTRRDRPSMFAELKEGFGILHTDRTILYIMVLAVSLFVFAMPFQAVFIPLIAVESLGMTKSEAGILISVVGAGALLGALVVATVGDAVRNRGVLMIGMIVIMALSLFLFARGGSLFTAVPALLIAGAMQTSFNSLNNAFVLGRTPQDMHGRVMSLFSLDRGLVPLGATLAGALAATLGPEDALTLMAAICLVTTLLIALLVPSLRKIA
jgi:MFS family permease